MSNSPSALNAITFAALSWLAGGVPLVPVQPKSKHLVAGFGPHLRRITLTSRLFVR